MLIVMDHSGNSEIINKFSDFEMYEELNGSFTLTFTSYRHVDNPGHDLIVQEGFVEYDGYKFRIKQIRRQPYSAQISCLSAYYDNVDVYKYDIYGGTRTLNEFLTYVLSGTGWSWISSNIDVEESKLIPNFGQGNVIQLMEALKLVFGFEVRIDRNNQITVSNQLGPDNDFQYRYGYNIVSLTESIDTTKLKTYIEGFGAEGVHATYTSPYSSTPGIGIRHAEPIFDESYTDDASLLEHLKTQLYDKPDSVVELDDARLLDRELGERVWLIHERMGLEYQTRVVTRRTKIPSSLSSVTLGTYLPQSRTISNALATQKVTIDRNNAIYRSRLEQTNSKIALEVERLDSADAVLQSSIVVEAGRISQEVTDRTNADATLQANITVEANRITTEVTNRQNGDTTTYNNSRTYTEQTATSILSEVSTEVTRLDGRVDSANSLISQQADEILLRVRKDGVISSINQTAEVIRISASKINLVGAVTFSDLNSGLATTVSDGSTAKGRTDNWIQPGTTSIRGGAIQTGSVTAGQINTDTLIVGTNLKVASNVFIGNPSNPLESKYILFYGPAGIGWEPSSDSIVIGAQNGVAITGLLTTSSDIYSKGNLVLTTASVVTAKFG